MTQTQYRSVGCLTRGLAQDTSLTGWKGKVKLHFSLSGGARGTWSLTPWSSGCSSKGSTVSSASRMLAIGMSEMAPHDDSVSPSPLSPFVRWRSSWNVAEQGWKECHARCIHQTITTTTHADKSYHNQGSCGHEEAVFEDLCLGWWFRVKFDLNTPSNYGLFFNWWLECLLIDWVINLLDEDNCAETAWVMALSVRICCYMIYYVAFYHVIFPF